MIDFIIGRMDQSSGWMCMTIWIGLIVLGLVSFAIFRTRLGFGFLRSLAWMMGLQLMATFFTYWSFPVDGKAPGSQFGLEVSPLLIALDRALRESFPSPMYFVFTNFVGILALLGAPFAMMLYQKWVGGKLTEAEKAEGAEGLRAWLRPANVAWALALGVAYSGLTSISLLMTVLFSLALLLVYPVFRLASGGSGDEAPSAAGAREDLTPEREQILRMIEEGKITAEEGAELLNALAAPLMARRPAGAPLSKGRKLILVGAGLVLVGFFLPWFHVDLNKEMQRLRKNFGGGNISINVPGNLNVSGQNQVLRLSGGDIEKGQGWMILLLALATAALPYVATELDEKSRQAMRFIAMGVGAILLLYLLSTNPRFVTYGLVVVLAGYAVQFVGALAESRGERMYPSA